MIRSRPKQVPLLEIVVILISIFILADFYFGFEITLLNNDLSVSPVVAITLIIAAASKFLFDYSSGNTKLLLPARILALCTVAIGIASFIALVFKLLPTGNLYDSMPGDVTASANDMALITAFSFILIGIALYRITVNNAKKIFVPHLISLIILLIALLSVITYFFHENASSKISFYKPMKIVVAMCFTLLAFSIVLVNRHKGFIGDLTSPYQGGKIARVLIPIAIIVPAILGFFQIRSENAGLYDNPYEVALLTLGRIIILVLFIWRVAVIINRSNKALLAELEVRKKNEDRLSYKKAVLEAQNEAIPDAILVVNTEGKILSYNHHFGKLWRLPQNILDERDDVAAFQFAITQVANPEVFINRVNDIYANPGKAAHDELIFKDGRIIERYGNVVIGDNGEKYGWVWYFRDVTLKKNYENKIKDFNKELETKVKERTEELNKSEKRFRSLIENAQDIISLTDENGIRFYTSPAIERVTGFTIQETTNQPVFNIVHPDDMERLKILRDDIMKQPGVIIPLSCRFKHKNGGYVWIEGTLINLLHDENVNAIVGNYHEITERKNAEESLRNSEKRFRSLIENSHDLISLSDGKANLFYVSPSIERITGYTIEETINRSVFSFIHPDDIKYGEKARQQFLKHPGVSIPLSFRYKHKNDDYIWMEGTIVNLLDDENVKAVVGNYHDVTERKVSEEKIRITNERFEMVSRATNDAVWDWNLETDEIYWNEAIKSMFDFCAEDIPTGTEWKVHIHPEDFKRVTKKLVYHIKNKVQNWQDEYRFLCADDTYKFVFNRGFILFNNDGKPYRIIGAMQDVTEINRLEQYLNDERIKKQKELTKATIVGQEKERTEIGRELHDNINQLLTATKLYLDVAASQPSMKDEMIKRSTENLSKCMDEIRKLSTALVPPSIDINSLSEIIQDLLEPIKLGTSINMAYEVKDINKTTLTTDQQLNVYRIIQEHINNIIKHSKAGNVSITITHINNHIDLKIKDDGKGFDVKAKRKGIGFKNIQSRAELLNGRMNVISKPGEGCLLEVNFPISQPET